MRCRDCTVYEDFEEKEALLIEAEERADENERLLLQCWDYVSEESKVKLLEKEPGLRDFVYDPRKTGWKDYTEGDVQSKLHALFTKED